MNFSIHEIANDKLAASLLNLLFMLFDTNSIGLRSGEYGGGKQDISRAARALFHHWILPAHKL